jgi:hypothetical protein
MGDSIVYGWQWVQSVRVLRGELASAAQQWRNLLEEYIYMLAVVGRWDHHCGKRDESDGWVRLRSFLSIISVYLVFFFFFFFGLAAKALVDRNVTKLLPFDVCWRERGFLAIHQIKSFLIETRKRWQFHKQPSLPNIEPRPPAAAGVLLNIRSSFLQILLTSSSNRYAHVRVTAWCCMKWCYMKQFHATWWKEGSPSKKLGPAQTNRRGWITN